MQLSVKGKQVDVGAALQDHVKSSLESIVGKYFDNPIEGSVVISKEARLFRADISVHVGRDILVQSHAESMDAYAAFEAAGDKIAKRLRRYKRRLRDHHKNRSAGVQALLAQQYILAGGSADSGEHEEVDDNQPVVIAEMTTEIDTLTVSEAVMRMDLADLPALLFRNRAHGGLNLVYRRPDGNVGWVDPQHKERAAE